MGLTEPRTLGYALAKSRPSMLIAREGQNLHYDLRSHKCLTYKSILRLADVLKKELAGLKAEGIM